MPGDAREKGICWKRRFLLPTCDGAFFEDFEVFVVAVEMLRRGSIYLTKFARKYRDTQKRSAESGEIHTGKAFANDRIEFMWDSVVKG